MEVEFFKGVRLSLGSPSDFEGFYSSGSKLKFVYVDLLDEYAFFWSSGSDMPFHNYMTDLILEIVSPCGFPLLAVRGDNERVPDIWLNDYIFEVETGLKHSLGALNSRLRKSRKFCYVVVPNSSVKRRYKGSLPSFRGRLLTLKELSLSFTC